MQVVVLIINNDDHKLLVATANPHSQVAKIISPKFNLSKLAYVITNWASMIQLPLPISVYCTGCEICNLPRNKRNTSYS